MAILRIDISPALRCSAFLAVALCLPSRHASAAAPAASLEDEYRHLQAEFAATVGDWRPKAPQSGALLFVAPDEYSGAASGGEAYRDVRKKYAEALFGLAKQAAEAGQVSLAFQWTTEVLREDPDQAGARRVLGYVDRDGEWLTPYGMKMRDAGKSWDAARGWVETGKAAAAKAVPPNDAARHADIKNGWQVRTDHFLVTTNHSQAAGAKLAARLERLYQIWRQLFAGFYYTDKEISGLFAGERIARVPTRQFRVIYHRNREDYVSSLVRREPKIGETLGYFDAVSEAHFFAPDPAAKGDAKENANHDADDEMIATLNHEAVHQLFQESKPAARHIGETGNFWVIEGVAVYFETLREHRDAATGLYFTIGEKTAGRLPAARDRLKDHFYVPLAELTKLGRSEFQRRADVAKLYSQSSALAAFLIDGERGRYREPFVRYLEAVYSRHDNDHTLAEVTGTSYAELDAAYQRFMESLP